MRYGRSVPSGWLPVFAVGTEKEAEMLLVLTCPKGIDKEFYARQLVHEQTLENLNAFSNALETAHEVLKKSGKCECKPDRVKK